MSPTVIVLAAGIGSRLATVWSGPKWLASHGSRCIADGQLEEIGRIQTNGVYVVVGHDAGRVASFLQRRGLENTVRLVDNPRYAEWNNWYSLVLGLEAARYRAPEEPVLVLNSDLVIPKGWIADFVEAYSRSGAPALVAVDDARVLSEEAMKVFSQPFKTEISDIAKSAGSAIPRGEYIGMALLSSSLAAALISIFEQFANDSSLAGDWYERGFSLAIKAGWQFGAWTVPHSDWIEVDDPVDFERAASLIQVSR